MADNSVCYRQPIANVEWWRASTAAKREATLASPSTLSRFENAADKRWA
jgi:hypothetical protein